MQTKEADLKSLIGNLNVGVYRRSFGVKGKFLFVNAALCQMLGYSQEEILNLKITDLFEDQRKFISLQEKLAKQGFLKNEEVQVLTKNRRILWVSVSSVLIKDKGGNPQLVDGIVEDITLQKKFEKDFRESKELFRTVFDNSPVAITVADKDEKIIAWNPFAETMLGMKKEDLFNKPLPELYPPKEWRRIRAFEIRKKGMLSDLEIQVYKKDGTIIDVNMSVSVLKDSNGNVTGSIGIMRDITQQKKDERRIKDSENKIRILLDNSLVAITLSDETERIISWNKYTEQLLGKGKDDLWMQPVSSLYPAEEWKRIRAENIRKKGSKIHFETRAFKKDGTIIDISLSVNVLKDSEGNIIGSVGILQDITEQKRAQQEFIKAKYSAEEANKSKTLFLANMSHEVRTPMNTILGTLDLVLDSPLNEEQKENILTAKDAADNLLSLINDILDLSRVEAGKINLEMIEMNLPNIIQSVCKGLSLLAKKRDLDLAWEVDLRIPQALAGDPTRVRQILVNLINNAIKFTFKGKVELKVKVEKLTEDDCEILFSIKDQGIGIPKNKQVKLFEVFSQVDESTTRRFGGTGLGLSISKSLVELMNGRIWVESEEFKGSTFYFTARFKVMKEEDAITPKRQFKETDLTAMSKPIEKLSILLAEDNIVNQKIAVKLLEKKGWVVTAVDNGQKVLDILDKQQFDIILMDAQMPVLDGLETTKLIRENETKTGKRIPILALTARAMSEDKEKCLKAGMDGYISKPIDRLQLYETVENIFKKGQPHA